MVQSSIDCHSPKKLRASFSKVIGSRAREKYGSYRVLHTGYRTQRYEEIKIQNSKLISYGMPVLRIWYYNVSCCEKI